MECALQKNSGWMVNIYYRFPEELLITLIIFLDEFDCMDRTDERSHFHGEWCPFDPDAMICDENFCYNSHYSCGDGECVGWSIRMAFQQFRETNYDCFNSRNLNYMCEVSPHRTSWTLESGLCWPDEDYDDPRYPPWNMINESNLTQEDKCEYLFRCALSKGFEHDCPCNHLNCTQMMMNVCSTPDHLIIYPREGLLNSNIYVMYNYSHSMEDPTPQFMVFSGGIKCRGFYFQMKDISVAPIDINLINYPNLNNVMCAFDDPTDGDRDFLSSQQNDKFCWNDSLTFSGRPYAVYLDMCTYSGECISQYRIRDGFWDCYDNQDEKMPIKNNYCTGNVGRQRFQCFNNEYKCFPLLMLGSGYADCSNDYDESWYGTGTDIRIDIPCEKETTTTDCNRLKEYIQESSNRNSTNNNSFVTYRLQKRTDRMPFRHYCDSFWNLDKHIDEMNSSCKYWICHQTQYQCRTGQCIELDWICDGEWDCSDASDEEAMFLIEKPLIHNNRFLNLFSYVEKCDKRYSNSSFSNICNRSFEFGCYRSGVSNPLDIQSNRPCINLTQIGDGIEDCYNAYDEKNTFTVSSNMRTMWGFNFRCGNDYTSYPNACDQSGNCTNILCSKYRDKHGSCSDMKDFICLDENDCKKNVRCNEEFDCFNGEDEYWCVFGTRENQIRYRHDKKSSSRISDEQPLAISYPIESMMKFNQYQLSTFIVDNQNNDESFKIHSYKCNRGISVIEMNEIRCLCPPAYYGDWCQFFSDRISIIARVDHKTQGKTKSNVTLKVKVNFLFNDRIIDHHEFNVVPIFERTRIIKHKFYLLYSRTEEMILHKQRRYFNRSDVINNHPYSVNFDVFALENNNNIEEMGSWHYPIYFDYLPAFRLAVVLKFPSWFGNVEFNPCSKNSCNKNSICHPVFNQNNSYYCSCKSGYYGINCSMYEPLCESYCSVNALCRPDDSDRQAKRKKIYCICPLGHFGSRCNLKYNDCHSNSCLNNGTCFHIYDPSGEDPSRCICSEYFYGSQCEDEKASVHIDLNMTRTLSARATVVQLYGYHHHNFLLEIEHQQISNGFPSSIRFYHADIYVPALGILKIYEDLSHAQYFLVYFLLQSKINLTISPQACLHTSLLLSEGQLF